MRRATTSPERKRTRQEATWRRLLEAAVRVVGESGYAASSVARVTAAAGVAHGTFYNYFGSQQDLFDALLPHLGQQLLDEIRAAIGAERDFWRREEIGFRAFFDFVRRHPQFYRILNEAETFAPAGYRAHIDNMVEGYRRAVRRGVREGVLRPLAEAEVEAVVLVLLAARNYLCMRYAFAGPLPDLVTSAYLDLVRNGLRRRNGNGVPASRPEPSRSEPAAASRGGPVWNVVPAAPAGDGTSFEGLLASGAVDTDAGGLARALADFSLAVLRAQQPELAAPAVVGLSVTTGLLPPAPIASVTGTIVRQSRDSWIVHAEIRQARPERPIVARGSCTLRAGDGTP